MAKDLMDVSSKITMDSREIAELTGKRHDNVIRDIETMLGSLGGLLRFEDTYRNEQNGQKYKCYKLPGHELMLLLTGYSVTLRDKVLRRWEELEQKDRAYAQLTGPALMAAALIEANKTLEALKPKADLADRMLNTGNLRTLTDVGKMLSKPRKIFSDLIERKIIFRRDGTLLPYQQYIDEGYFVIKYNIVKINETEKRVPQMYVTAHGERWLADTIYPPRLNI